MLRMQMDHHNPRLLRQEPGKPFRIWYTLELTLPLVQLDMQWGTQSEVQL